MDESMISAYDLMDSSMNLTQTEKKKGEKTYN